jgi:hypothetical protein
MVVQKLRDEVFIGQSIEQKMNDRNTGSKQT